tara:strand:+ start:116 stop:484 length:369 start_codon:yes stop_codon:yes gene_type:complete
MRKLLVIFILSLTIFLPSVVFGKDINGTAWLVIADNVEKKVILFEDDGTFIYLNILSTSGNQGKIFSDSSDTWKMDGDLVTISYTGGYKLVSLTINKKKDRMSGTAVNKAGNVQKIVATQIK